MHDNHEWLKDFIAIMVILGFFAMAFIVALTKLDLSDHDVLYMLVGQMAAGFIQVLSSYFGNKKK